MNDATSFWFLMTGVFALSTVYLAVSRRRARKRTEKYIDRMMLDRQGPELAPSAATVATPTLESLANAIERLTQQQQFLIRVMSERPTHAESPSRGTAKWVTPH